MALKILLAMGLQFLNLLASIAICLISFFALPSYYPNYQSVSSGIMVVMALYLIIFPCYILALTAAIAYLQGIVFSFSKTGQLKESRIAASLFALFAPSLLTGFVAWNLTSLYWDWYAYLIIPFMMLAWIIPTAKLIIWQTQTLQKPKNRV
jgi:hypothetical protein